ncbi:hypothetical protein ACFSKL_07000 [Belliella marina]|uniref:Uncharacterized protein n=1 Tax=Belliella marina TaxID=1644146 RepID=A0ABW4VMP5_9BACT
MNNSCTAPSSETNIHIYDPPGAGMVVYPVPSNDEVNIELSDMQEKLVQDDMTYGGVSRVIPIAGVAYSGWTIGDAIGSNIETVSETVAGWLMELVVPAAVLSNQDMQLSPGEIGKLKDAGFDPHELS